MYTRIMGLIIIMSESKIYKIYLFMYTLGIIMYVSEKEINFVLNVHKEINPVTKAN